MPGFFDNIDPDDATQVEQLARLMFDFRTNRDHLLGQYAVADAEALLEKIHAGEVAEHPGYEHYLSLKILDDMQKAVRSELSEFLPGVKLS